MEPENPTPAPEERRSENGLPLPAPETPQLLPPPESHGLHWIFIGPNGLRAGWSVAIFFAIFIGLGIGMSAAAHAVMHAMHITATKAMTAKSTIVNEGLGVLALLIAAFVVSRIERRRVVDYNLRGPKRLAHFGVGLLAGFAALSVLVGAMAAGGWLHIGSAGMSDKSVVIYACAWGVAFLLVGCMEEGLARCYLLFTLGRGLNFWWALGLVALMCGRVALTPKANGAWGAYAIALLGLVPCFLLQMRKAPSTGFWNAAWVTSAFFGAAHTGNGGENWIGIFAAAGIGFVFCVSVYVTGSAWWAIGCHAAWDWGETYFYGTADSGFVAKGHLLSAAPAGNVLWSGGADGPEGSLLVLAVIVLLLIALLAIYGRRPNGAARLRAME
jgi:membrane protease YdiL (CAAX protease family)